MENKLQMKINKTSSKVKEIRKKISKRNEKIKQIKLYIERLNKKMDMYVQRHNFYIELINLESNEQRKEYIKTKKQEQQH